MATTVYTIGSPIAPSAGGTVYAGSLLQTRIACDGGYRLDLSGTFPVGQRLNVHIGSTGTTLDAKCYAGKAGQSTTIYAVDSGHLYCFTPRLPSGGPFALLVRSLDSGMESLISEAVFTIKPDFKTSVMALRSMFPNVFLVGPRKMEDVAPIAYNEGAGLVTLMRDDFYVDGEFSKWFVPPGLPDPVVEGGLCKLHESGIQGILFNEGGSGLWTEYTAKARIRGTNDPSYSGFGIAVYGDVATINGYASLIDLNTGYSNLIYLTFGSGSPIESVLLADKGIVLDPSEWFEISLKVAMDPSDGIRLITKINDILVHDAVCASPVYTQGAPGLLKSGAIQMDCDWITAYK